MRTMFNYIMLPSGWLWLH